MLCPPARRSDGAKSVEYTLEASLSYASAKRTVREGRWGAGGPVLVAEEEDEKVVVGERAGGELMEVALRRRRKGLKRDSLERVDLLLLLLLLESEAIDEAAEDVLPAVALRAELRSVSAVE